MRLAIMGSGGVGGYYGARLVTAGHDVHFVARGAHAETMRERGLLVRSDAGDVQLERVSIVEDPKEIGSADLVVIAVNTAHIVFPTLVERSPLPLLSIVEATYSERLRSR